MMMRPSRRLLVLRRAQRVRGHLPSARLRRAGLSRGGRRSMSLAHQVYRRGDFND
jgi:hypothetical protein